MEMQNANARRVSKNKRRRKKKKFSKVDKAALPTGMEAEVKKTKPD